MSKKHIEVIIMKQNVAGGFYLGLRGHAKNPKFKSFISERIPEYKAAYNLAHVVGTALALAGNAVQVLNDQYAEEDGNAYCEHMAFNSLQVFQE
jgi:hypothetical protein